MPKFRSIKTLFFLHAGVFALLFAGTSLGIIQFHYPRAVENDPLLSPFSVSSVIGDNLILEDGRRFQVLGSRESLDTVVEESQYRVDLEPDGDDIYVFVKRRGWICGTPWVALIQI